MTPAESTDLLARHLGRLLRRLAGEPFPGLGEVLDRIVRRTVAGHIAVDLREESGDLGVDVATLRRKLLASGLAGVPGDYRPLVLDTRDRLYLYRYWQDEKRVAEALGARAAWLDPDVDPGRVTALLDALFGGEGETRQKTAAALAAVRRLTVVSGGPGTGKTTAVLRILALLLELDPALRIGLAAPTGKAAARVSEALSRAVASPVVGGAARERIPREASTVHRLLGVWPGGFRYHADNPLPWDVVVVDEASMIGVTLMARLLDALRPETRLVLLGDRDQLSSVEPGSVLGDICGADLGFSKATAALLAELGVPQADSAAAEHVLQDCVVRLTHSFRFGGDSGIGRLAGAVRRGDADGVLAVLRDPALPEVRLCETRAVAELHERLGAELPGRLAGYLRSVDDAAAALAGFERFRLLCAFRHGPAGVAGLNALAERCLSEAGLIDTGQRWYAGRPVMVTRNDYASRLFNGDVGVTCRIAGGDEPRVVFPGRGEPRILHTPRIPEHETVYAMTVHKSQGSEFDEIALVLPEVSSELLSRELIYTAVTRAREGVTIYGSEEVLRGAVEKVQRRVSGLGDRFRVSSPGVPTQGKLF